MFGLNFYEACDLCDISAAVRSRVVSDLSDIKDGQIILFKFDRTHYSLGKYLYYLFCSNNILVLNPEFRDEYSPEFHDNVPFNYQDGFSESWPKGSKQIFSALLNELVSHKIRLVIPTSGSTSIPKLICYSAACIESAASAIYSETRISIVHIWDCSWAPTWGSYLHQI